jgi:hypothetical protein
METLRAAIANNKRFEPVDLSMFWDLIGEMEYYVPDQVFVRRHVRDIRRAARLVFLSQITGRQINHFADLWGMEAYLIGEWFSKNKNEYAAWCLDHVTEIHQAAGIVDGS